MKPGVKIDVEVGIKQVQIVDTFSNCDVILEGPGKPAGKDKPLTGEHVRAMNGLLLALKVEPTVHLCEIMKLELELIIVGLDLKSRPEVHTGRQIEGQARHVEPACASWFKRSPRGC